MNKKIDGVFTYRSYRYIPYDLKNEWKTIYNSYYRNFYENLHKSHKIFPQMRIDYYNEELNRLNNLKKICLVFKKDIKNIKSKYENEKKYTILIKKDLINSINKINTFLNNKLNLLDSKLNTNKIPIKKNIETFKNCSNLDTLSNKSVSLIISLIIIILFFYITFEY